MTIKHNLLRVAITISLVAATGFAKTTFNADCSQVNLN